MRISFRSILIVDCCQYPARGKFFIFKSIETLCNRSHDISPLSAISLTILHHVLMHKIDHLVICSGSWRASHLKSSKNFTATPYSIFSVVNRQRQPGTMEECHKKGIDQNGHISNGNGNYTLLSIFRWGRILFKRPSYPCLGIVQKWILQNEAINVDFCKNQLLF